jgi:hypothetical protein
MGLCITISISIKFWGVTPCSPVEVHRIFGGTYTDTISRVEEYAQKETIMEVAASSFETSVDFYRTTWLHISKDTLHKNILTALHNTSADL